MNMIVCNEKCRHQEDGYCILNGMAQITNALASPCCYFESATSKSPPVNSSNTVPKGGII
ncbi:MAG: hypothetical protein FWG45_05680 [Oscillospiraceae bacterium]|nr:hypothetical protein [Oscillospiraceae bacterium]